MKLYSNTVCPTKFDSALLWPNTSEFEAKSGKNPGMSGLFTS